MNVWRLKLSVAVLACMLAGQSVHAQAVSPSQCSGDEKLPIVTFRSTDGAYLLHGALYKPSGPGPFPVILWNHGSEQCPEPELASLPQSFVRAGYVFFAPFREGHANSEGTWIPSTHPFGPSVPALLRAQVANDVAAGLEFLRSQPFVDSSQVAVMGGSYGGIETIFAAADISGFRAAVDCSGAAQSWANVDLRMALLNAVSKITIPVYLIQAENDFDLGPSIALSAEFDRLGKSYAVKIYPPYGEGARGPSGHELCFVGGLWTQDAMNFIADR